MKHPALAVAVALLGLVTFTGCTTSQASRVDNLGPSYIPQNVSGVPVWPAEIVRVAVLPVADATGRLSLAFVSTYDTPWREALQRSQRAEFVGVDRAAYTRWIGSPVPPTSTALLPGDWASRIAAATGADAALLLDVTSSSPYAPLSLGLRAKLVRLDTGDIIWAADELFDASNPLVERGARRHARARQLSREGDAIAVLQSPGRFAAYVCDTLAGTLPPR